MRGAPIAKRGPNTTAGKATVSRNAVRHGIRSDIAVIDGIEDPKEWEWHREGIIDAVDNGDLRADAVLDSVEADDGLSGLGLWAAFGYGSPRNG